MRQDQYERLLALQDKLIDALLLEMDPEQWPGAGMAPNAMDQQTRGDRYWAKKNLAATQSVVMRNASLIGVVQRRSAEDKEGMGVKDGLPAADEGGVDAEIAAHEKEAQKLLDKISKEARAR